LKHSWKSRREKTRQGIKTKHNFPCWIDPETGRVIEAKADIIRRIYAMFKSGFGGPLKIARTLNAEGIKPPGWGGQWTGSGG
jgi:DNA invertase Pin-like site-specific DNA recombinase